MDKNRKEKIRRRFKVFSAIAKLLVLLFILVGIPLYIYFFQYDLIERFSSLEAVEAFFEQYKTASILVYMGMQVLQIIICIIPGQALQFAAGYMFGFWMGYLWSFIGATVGTIITYYLAKLLGHDAMHMIFGEEKIKSLLKKLNTKKAMVIIFLFYLIPGVPKDICSYAAGISEMKLKPFLIVSLVGRTPGMMGSLLIGRQMGEGYYFSAIVIAVIAVALCILGVIFRKKITVLLDKAYGRLIKM